MKGISGSDWVVSFDTERASSIVVGVSTTEDVGREVGRGVAPGMKTMRRTEGITSWKS